MGRQPGFFDVDARLRELLAKGDDLERISGLIDFEICKTGGRQLGTPNKATLERQLRARCCAQQCLSAEGPARAED